MQMLCLKRPFEYVINTGMAGCTCRQRFQLLESQISEARALLKETDMVGQTVKCRQLAYSNSAHHYGCGRRWSTVSWLGYGSGRLLNLIKLGFRLSSQT